MLPQPSLQIISKSYITFLIPRTFQNVNKEHMEMTRLDELSSSQRGGSRKIYKKTMPNIGTA